MKLRTIILCSGLTGLTAPVHAAPAKLENIAAWKAHGELKLRPDGTATGFINQKTHITELRCTIRTN